MGFDCGIIGLPNVGKSTIFNALSGAGAHVANFPFCTIEPNRGVVPVPDARLLEISRLLQKPNPIPTRIEFIDVAGLVEGASRGEGLGNKFLGNIRETDAVVHVVRCFHGGDVIHVTGELDPVRDVEIVNTEILLADMEVLRRADEKVGKLARMGEKAAKHAAEVIEKCLVHLNGGKSLRALELHDDERAELSQLGLISLKPVLYCANVDEGGGTTGEAKALVEYARGSGDGCIAIQGKLEGELAELPPGDKEAYMRELGLEVSGLDRLIEASYALLGLVTYYTAATELQAWTLRRGTRAVEAAGKIHTDFAKGFVRAEVYSYADLAETGSEHLLRDKGRLRVEGKEYVVQDGDIVKYLFHP